VGNWVKGEIMRFAKKTSLVLLGIVAALLFAVPAAVGASGASTAATYCTGTIEFTTIPGDLNAGPGCFLNFTTVEGDVTVLKGGSFDTFSSVIDGNVRSKNATRAFIGFFTDVHGSVNIQGSTESAGLGKANVDGNVVLSGNAGQIAVLQSGSLGNLRITHNSLTTDSSVSEISFGGNVVISNNTGQIFVSDASITKNLICFNNQPPVIAFNDTITAQKVLGECAIETSP
jgi:hypothetical protein